MNRTATDPSDHVTFDHVRMAFGERVVFDALSCGFPRGKISVILGGSGSGKSTILRLIGGLVRPAGGTIVVDGEPITELSERRMYDVRRKLGMMFQHGALLDSLTIFDNLAFPLREHTQMSPAEIEQQVHETLAAVGMTNVDDLLPGELSGGMLKRAALARAIIRKPLILLCDEPFSGLDPASTKRIERLLRRLNRDSGISMLVVSHHIPSTLRMAHRILLLLPAQEPITGSPQALLESGDPRVKSFLNEDYDESDETLLESEPEAVARASAAAPRGQRW